MSVGSEGLDQLVDLPPHQESRQQQQHDPPPLTLKHNNSVGIKELKQQRSIPMESRMPKGAKKGGRITPESVKDRFPSPGKNSNASPDRRSIAASPDSNNRQPTLNFGEAEEEEVFSYSRQNMKDDTLIWAQQEIAGLRKIKPFEWINIPAPVRDAVATIRDSMEGVMNRLVKSTKNFRELEDRLTMKEQRQKQSIDDVMTFVKDKMNQ